MLYLIIFILIFIIFNFFNSIFIEKFENNKKNIILLTMCVKTHNNSKKDEDYRFNLYKKNIDLYLKNTNLDIYVIESSNNKKLKEIYKNNKRIHIHIFDLHSKKYIKNRKNSTHLEVLSLLEAYKYFKLYKCNNIIKITGRYYVPNIYKIINLLDNKKNLYIQNRVGFNGLKQTEILGFKSKYFCKIFKKTINEKKIFEKIITELNNEEKGKVLPKIILNESVKRGGDNKRISYL